MRVGLGKVSTITIPGNQVQVTTLSSFYFKSTVLFLNAIIKYHLSKI